MNKSELKSIVDKMKTYNLYEAFKNVDEFDNWLKNLNSKQIKNLISINSYYSYIKFPIELLINKDLLNCDDYLKRIDAISKIKNFDGLATSLILRLCSPNFLNSKNYYKDIELISKMDSIRYALWIINSDEFINSKYHNEDLKLIVESSTEDKNIEFVLKDALAVVAGNKNSINSKYHREDMKLIATSNPNVLQSSHSYPEQSLNNLAINKTSLNDIYHLENMQILSKNPDLSYQLYKAMTNPYIIKGTNYRTEIEVLANSKSKTTAIAIYNFMTNYDIIEEDCREFSTYDYKFGFRIFHDSNIKNILKKDKNPRYLEFLKLINKIDDNLVIPFSLILCNKDLLNSKYLDHDINLLLKVSDKKIFEDLARLAINKTSLSSKYHEYDMDLISKVDDEYLRDFLLFIATNENSLNSTNHEYDMKYISSIDINNINHDLLNKIRYYLENPKGINHPKHIEIINYLLNGIEIDSSNEVLDYLNNLSTNLDNREYNNKALYKIKKLLFPQKR